MFAALRAWLEAGADALTALWTSRKAEGCVRECHGDLHLANVVTHDGGVVAFDCIEFDPALRWVDVLDDVTFAVMDLDARGRRDLAFRLLNGWLDRTGDHGGLPALRFSLVYRAGAGAGGTPAPGQQHRGATLPAGGRWLDTAG
ncbi:hypothetical protein LP415_06550 [Polaromonas sp. P1(28)-8]|nr:hypothetical protein LP415_06550 [Polaromonas sp. P1(28)-8]